MCGYGYMYYDRYSLQRHKPVWQCGTCGRVSSVPLDCCARPDFAQQHPAGLVQLLGQWLSGCGRRTLERLRPLWRWQCQRATGASTPYDNESPVEIGTAGVMVPTTESDEQAEMEDSLVVAGERL